MKNRYIPTCYFPSTVLLVDDSRDFLLNFTLQLEEGIAYKLYNSPYAALKEIHNTHQPEPVNQRVLTEYLDTSGCPISNYTVNVDLAAIHSEVYNPRRFREVAVVVVDYAMPGMDGLEFCRKMENSPVKRILLTGRADEKTAVRAFNDGIIDLYIQKQNPEIMSTINESIRDMQFRYFQHMSDIVIRMLSVRSPNCLQDPVFIENFDRICKENNIVEYYLTENSGSFLMLDADANIFCLVVKSEQDLKLHYEMALDNRAPQAILDQLQKGEKIPYFWNAEKYYQSEWDDWSTYLYPAKIMEGKQRYYYSFVKTPLSIDIQTDKIASFHTYLESLDSREN